MWSASRRRRTRPRITAIDISKFSARHFLKSRLVIASSSQGSSVTTLAERGLSSIRPISPKNSPGPRMAEDHFLAVGVAHHHLEAAGDDDVERIGRVAGGHDDRAARRRCAASPRVASMRSWLLGEAREQRHRAQHCRRDCGRHRPMHPASRYVSKPRRAARPRAARPALLSIMPTPKSVYAAPLRTTPCPTRHHRLAHPRFRPGRLHRRGVRRARQPQAGADHRPRPGRPADDHHRRRQLARRRRRRAGPGADGALPEARRALRHRNRVRPDPHGRAGRAAVRARGRHRHLHLRRADHRHRRLGALPRPALGAEIHGQGRVGLRHLRRLLLQGPGRGRGRRRQHRGRGSAVPRQHRAPGHA